MQDFESKPVEDILSNSHLVEDNDDEEMEDTISPEEKIELPKVGMVFNSFEGVFKFYKRYGKSIGFEGVIRSSRKGDDGQLKFVTMCCLRYGKPRSKSANAFKMRPVKNIDCKARLGASIRPDGNWQVRSIIFDHNHELTTPAKARFLKSNRILKTYVKRKLELNDRAGIRMNKSFNCLAVEAGGQENLSFLERDCRNHVNKVRHLQLRAGDATAIQNYFKKMQGYNSNFFYAIDLDKERRLKNVLWADARSRAAYKEFGDVITFDTTYLTNRYDMPFAAFVGVNHHGKSTLLGCGLISNEDTETFIRLFESWHTCMMGIAPKAIITDQDKAMQKAIEFVFPNTRHKWCLWHIMKKLPEKLRGYKEYDSIKFNLQNIIYDSLTPAAFEGRWDKFIEKYNLSSNEWLLGLYNERRRWVPSFVKNYFWAGMSTTQRSESMRAFFDEYVNSKTTLKQFVEQYESTLKDKVEKENQADFNSFNSQIPCMTHYAIEKQFQDVYTTTKFKEFQRELSAKIYCEVSLYKENGVSLEFIVNEDVKIGETLRRDSFIVFLNMASHEVNCNCQLFEFKGILCQHAIAVLLHKSIFHVPPKYILIRWRKDIKRCHTKVKVIYDNWSVKPESHRLDKMCNLFYKVEELASSSEEKCNLVVSTVNDLETKLSESFVNRKQSKISSIDGIRSSGKLDGTSAILTPLVVQSKGRP